ncbi:hypothetical protein BDV34DRAFT_227418 [Aspergillus parasiticus]|uniref:Uncharacterized protein n=1 Tax=Aspergillus parasiticus TaxID=5067 RepID=A0A5N6DE34_ASPPA|nr:hypothetical protein BDV34DRAFT_227418 [Aspergillus parasiticus]
MLNILHLSHHRVCYEPSFSGIHVPSHFNYFVFWWLFFLLSQKVEDVVRKHDACYFRVVVYLEHISINSIFNDASKSICSGFQIVNHVVPLVIGYEGLLAKNIGTYSRK